MQENWKNIVFWTANVEIILRENMKENSAVLIKGSNGMNLINIVNHLK